MFVKHSLTNVRRSWKKSLLFFFLIFALVIIICIAASLISIINAFLNDSTENYKSIGVFEYMGASYPDELTYDPQIKQAGAALGIDKIVTHPGTLNWDANAAALGFIEGRLNFGKSIPYPNAGVFVVRTYAKLADNKKDIITSDIVHIVESLYSTNAYMKGKMIYLNTNELGLKDDRYYLIHGEFYQGQTSYIYFEVKPFSNKAAAECGFDGSLENMVLDITVNWEKYKIPENTHFHEMAKFYNTLNNGVTVKASSDLSLLHEFHQGQLYLIDGRYPTAEEYASGASVCLLPEKIAKAMGKDIGDKITLSVALKEDAAQNESYWTQTGFGFSDEYEIVGIINSYDVYAGNVYIPKSGKIDFSINTFSFVLGQVLIENSLIDEFVADITPSLPERVRLTVYDQGYALVYQSLSDVMIIAKIILTICLVVGVAIIVLFGFLFVYRQKESALIMRRLGAKKSDIYTYYLFGSGGIALAAVIAGIVISLAMSGLILELVKLSVSNYVTKYSLYSSSNLSLAKPIIFAGGADITIFLLIGGLTFLAAIMSSFIFSALCIKSHKNRRRISLLALKTRSNSLNGGALKYAWLSIKRGFSRTAIPVIVTACIVVLFFQLIHISFIYDQKLQDLKENSTIQGVLTDIKGRKTDGIIVDGFTVNEIYRSGMIADVTLTNHINFLYRGITIHDEIETGLPKFQPPSTGFTQETLINQIGAGTKLIFTNNFEKSPEFYYNSKVTTEFLPGYDLSMFESSDENALGGCIVSTDFMAVRGIELGDTIQLLYYSYDFYTYDIKVVGSFVKAGTMDNIYLPLRYTVPVEIFFEESQERLSYYSFESMRFTVPNGAKLDAFKQYLIEKGYSEVGKVRQKRLFIMLEDKEFLRSISAMTQRIGYMNVTFPLIYAIGLALGGLIPYILIQLRKREIAVMRAQGASKGRALMSMLIEQVLLSAVGLVLGLGVWALLGNSLSILGFILTAAYFAAWLIGTFKSIKKINDCTVQSILKAEE